MSIRLAVISLWAEDVPKAAHFYRDVVGLTPQPHHGQPHFDLGGMYLTILPGRTTVAATETEQALARFPLIAFAVADLDAATARLAAHGVEMPWGIEADAASRWIMFHDPAGNLVELVESGAQRS